MVEPRRTRARIGVLVPFTNTNLEPDLVLLSPPEVSLHATRLGGYDASEVPDASQMADLGSSDIQEPLRLLAGIDPDVVLYGCTSATLALGPEFDRELSDHISEFCGARTITAASALVHALRHQGITQIAFASPYVSVLNDRAIRFLTDASIVTVSRAEVSGILDNEGQGRMTPEQVFDLGRRADSSRAEAIVLSCTDMRAVEAIDALEKETGKPVITSNQAMMFQALSTLNLPFPGKGYGRLFTENAPPKATGALPGGDLS